MIELIDNTAQCIVFIIGCAMSGVMFYKSRKQPYFLLCCFYITFFLGTMYWALHEVIFRQTPQFFYVAEPAWIASYAFLLAIQLTLCTPEEKKFKTPFVWIVPIICVPQFILYLTKGDILLNVAMCLPTMAIGWLSARGLVFTWLLKEKSKIYFHIGVLCFVFLEYALWTISCFWMGDTILNPYFVCDFLMSLSTLAFFSLIKRVVGK